MRPPGRRDVRRGGTFEQAGAHRRGERPDRVGRDVRGGRRLGALGRHEPARGAQRHRRTEPGDLVAGALVGGGVDPRRDCAPAEAVQQRVHAALVARGVQRVEGGVGPPAGDHVGGAVAARTARGEGRHVVERVVQGEPVEHRVVGRGPGRGAAGGAGELAALSSGAPDGVAVALPAGHSARSTATARSASSTQPRTATWVAPSGASSRSTTQRSGSGGSAEPVAAGRGRRSSPRSSASGIAQCRCTPGGRGVAGVERCGAAPSPCPSGASTASGSRTIGSAPPAADDSACTSTGTQQPRRRGGGPRPRCRSRRRRRPAS